MASIQLFFLFANVPDEPPMPKESFFGHGVESNLRYPSAAGPSVKCYTDQKQKTLNY